MALTGTQDPTAYERMQRQAQDPMGVTLTLSIRLHANGAMSVEGPIADPAFCRHLLDEAWHAIQRQGARPTLIVPGNDVDSKARDDYTCPSS